MAGDGEEARGVYTRMNRVVETFLGRSIGFAGAVPLDPNVATAVRYRLPFTLAAPDAPATRAVQLLARRLAGVQPEGTDRRPRNGFFSRVAGWLAGEPPPAMEDLGRDQRFLGAFP
jgi:flagellar biosynthesis protein FlhG